MENSSLSFGVLFLSCEIRLKWLSRCYKSEYESFIGRTYPTGYEHTISHSEIFGFRSSHNQNKSGKWKKQKKQTNKLTRIFRKICFFLVSFCCSFLLPLQFLYTSFANRLRKISLFRAVSSFRLIIHKSESCQFSGTTFSSSQSHTYHQPLLCV